MATEVLIVDDDRTAAKVMARAVERAGYAIRTAGDGEAALREIRRARPHAVVLDLLLPTKDGLAVLRELAADAQTRDLPVVAVSGVYRESSHASLALETGARTFLAKPFRGTQLLAALEEAIGAPAGGASPTRSRVTDLASTPACELIWACVESEVSGALHFRDGKRRKALLLARGEPVAVRSNLATETLSRRLFDRGLIDGEQLAALRERARRGGLSEQTCVADDGLLSGAELQAAIAALAAARLLQLFSWESGEAWLEEGVRELVGASRLRDWNSESMLLLGADHAGPRQIRALLEPFAQHRIAFDPEDLAGLEVGSAVPELAAKLEPGQSVADWSGALAPALYALWRVGRLRLVPPGDRGAAERTSLARDLAERLESWRRQNLFDVLGLAPSATPAEILRALGEAEQAYDPKCFRDEPKRVRDVAARLWLRLQAAREVLCDDHNRQAYIARLAEWNEDGPEREEITALACADAEYHRAEDLVRQRRYTDACQALERALQGDSADSSFHALYGWALFWEKREDLAQRRRAIEHLVKAGTLDKSDPTPTYYLALVSKALGHGERAQVLLRRTLQIDPGHRAAERELRLLRQRAQKR